MTKDEARQIIASWLVSSKGEKGQCGYIEGWFYEKDVEAFCMAIEALEQEPKRGKWILDEEVSKKHIEPIYICSACKNYEAWGNTEKTPFCPNCGARMESEEI